MCFFYVQILTLFCQNLSASGGFAPWPPTRGSAPRPRWGLCPQTPVIGSRSKRSPYVPDPCHHHFWCKVAPLRVGGVNWIGGQVRTVFTVLLNIFETEQLQIGNRLYRQDKTQFTPNFETRQNCFVLSPVQFTPPTPTRQLCFVGGVKEPHHVLKQQQSL